MWPIDIDEPHLFDFMNDHFLTLLIALMLRTEYMIKDISIIPTHMPTIIREAEVGILNQRSNDFLTANNWNVVQYALLIHIFAKVSNLEVGELVHVIADAHIYDRHIPIVKELIEKPTFKAPKLVIDDFDDFTKNRYTILVVFPLSPPDMSLV